MPSKAQAAVEDRRFPSFAMDNVLRRIFLPPGKLVSKYVSPGFVVADLGCASGYFTLPMAKIVGPTGKIYAVDFDAKMIERLERKAEKQECGRVIEAHAASASEVDFIPEASVDFVFAHGLLCCMKDHAGALAQISRILKKPKPGGRAYLSVTKFYRKNDPRGVSREEWDAILRSFAPLEESGAGFFSRWAVVRPGEKKIVTSLPEIKSSDSQEGVVVPRGCCCCR